MMHEQNRQNDFIERYESGRIPWDDELPPPEVIQLVQDTKPGKALDLGCGYGRSGIYLAQHGWQVDGVDFVPKAVEIARQRADDGGVGHDVSFYAASVTDLSFFSGPYDLAIDIGCMHSLTKKQLVSYRDELLRLVGIGGSYLLFAHLRDELSTKEDERRWIEQDFLIDLFRQGFVLNHMALGMTQVEDKAPWKSGWFLFDRIMGNEQ